LSPFAIAPTCPSVLFHFSQCTRVIAALVTTAHEREQQRGVALADYCFDERPPSDAFGERLPETA